MNKRISLLLAIACISVFASTIYASLASANNSKPTTSLPLHEATKEKVVDFILDNYPDWASAKLPEFWTKELVKEPDSTHYRECTVIFEGSGWRIEVKTPHTITPIHEVSVQYTEDIYLSWNGVVQLESGEVMEQTIDDKSGEPGIKTEQAPI